MPPSVQTPQNHNRPCAGQQFAQVPSTFMIGNNMTKTAKKADPLHVHDVRLFNDYEDDYDVLCSQFWLLSDIWERTFEQFESAFAFLAFRCVETGRWHEHAISKSESNLEVCRLLESYSRWEFDQYFCPNLFSKPRRQRRHALKTRFGWCDIDGSNPEDYDPDPSLVWETSPGRYQALWAWDSYHEPDEAERHSKALAYRHGGDRNGWSITKMLRLMGSVNHKLQYDEPYVYALDCDWTKISERPVALTQDTFNSMHPLPEVDVDPTALDRDAVIKKFSKDLHPKARAMMRNRKAYEPNRSAQIFHMIAALHEAGACHDEIASVIWPNPYFVEKHGHDIGKLNEEIARVVGKLGDDA